MSSPIDNTWPNPPCANLPTLEKRKFQEDSNGDVCVNVCADLKPSSFGQTPTFKRVTITLADTEQSFVFPDKTRQYTIRNHGNGIMKFTFTSGESGTQYRTLYPYELVEKENVYLTGKTLYFQSTKAGDVLEIEYWV